MLRLDRFRVARAAFALTASFAAFVLVPSLAIGCAAKHGGSSSGMEADASSSAVLFDSGHLDEAYHPDASCAVTIDTPPLLPGSHVAIGSAITWSSNPPSSGPHYPIWAAFKAYDHPVDRGYTVHDLEHGAIVFSYRCDDPAGCPAIAAGLAQAASAIPDDPLCAAQTGGSVRVRVVITPDPLLDVPVAAAAWGWTYKADCVDVPTLSAFARDHYGQSPEVICADGQSQF